ncbi:mannose-P-dolichol utilization defect 1 protein homolog isoform X2 [Rhodnius prolixus]|uniref:mannose-P-dolichol utilization defect 1 protein homolog isoform X2 n=1 Tax=Rhodnius prolixus TaxID=13249 RepID=UPI003D18DC59
MANSTPLVKHLLVTVLSEKCYNEFFINLNFLNVMCLKVLVSKMLGFAIIGGSLMVKVPQIMKIWANESAQGVNFLSVLTDLYAISAATSYSFVRSFPFSAYGEGLFLGVQTLMIAMLVLRYNVNNAISTIFTCLYAVVIYILVTMTPVQTLWSMQATSVPVLFAGKVPFTTLEVLISQTKLKVGEGPTIIANAGSNKLH